MAGYNWLYFVTVKEPLLVHHHDDPGDDTSINLAREELDSMRMQTLESKGHTLPYTSK